MYLVDTDVLSALRGRKRNPRVVQWLSSQRTVDLFLSVVSVGEIERGIVRQQSVNPGFARALSAWLDGLTTLYGNRILGVNLAVARRWGQLSAKIGHDGADLLVAATALEHGLIVVTRNVRHFRPTGVELVDPSGDPPIGP